MKIVLNQDKEFVSKMKQKIYDNDGYCPCSVIKNDNTKCMCKVFREQSEPGFCHCMLYKKVEE